MNKGKTTLPVRGIRPHVAFVAERRKIEKSADLGQMSIAHRVNEPVKPVSL